MTLIVETGSIVTNANSYISTTDFAAYAAARGITVTGDAEQLLIQAMDYLEQLHYKGVKKTQDQSLQWPRIQVYIDGYYFASDDIPQQLINAQCEVALAVDAGTGPLEDLVRATKSEKVGSVEVTYMDGSVSAVMNKKIGNSLSKLIVGGGVGSNILPVNKG